MRVLIGDGQKDVGMSLATLVERCGHEVVLVAGSGLETIQAYARLEPDVVLIDYAIPRLNGVVAARMIPRRNMGMSGRKSRRVSVPRFHQRTSNNVAGSEQVTVLLSRAHVNSTIAAKYPKHVILSVLAKDLR